MLIIHNRARENIINNNRKEIKVEIEVKRNIYLKENR